MLSSNVVFQSANLFLSRRTDWNMDFGGVFAGLLVRTSQAFGLHGDLFSANGNLFSAASPPVGLCSVCRNRNGVASESAWGKPAAFVCLAPTHWDRLASRLAGRTQWWAALERATLFSLPCVVAGRLGDRF